MPKPPTHPPVLPRDVALRVAGLARVPAQECEPFCDSVCHSVQMVWEQDRRSVSSKPRPGRALVQAAQAARALDEAVCSLNKEDREWVDRLVANHAWLAQEERLRDSTEPFQINELHRTVWLLSFLFNTAVGRSSPVLAGTATLHNQRGRRRGTVKDMTFEVFVRHLLLSAAEAGGDLTLDKNFKKGTLIDALNILRPYIPKGVVPNVLPLGTLQRIKTKYFKSPR